MQYKGDSHQKFFHLIQHLLTTQQKAVYHIYQGRTEDKIQVFIEVNSYTIQEAEERLEILSAILEQKLEKEWKCLPSSSLPEDYNIVTLPYQHLLAR